MSKELRGILNYGVRVGGFLAEKMGENVKSLKMTNEELL